MASEPRIMENLEKLSNLTTMEKPGKYQGTIIKTFKSQGNLIETRKF